MGLLNFFSRQTVPSSSSGYRVFTRRYDRIVAANGLDSVLGALDAASTEALRLTWKEYQDGLSGRKAKATLRAMELSQAIRGDISNTARNDTLVAILVDQSGSMRGQKMLMTVMAVDVLQAALAGIGVRCEVLGFTTVGWKGGKSRRLWKLMGRRSKPGRLCDLLHVIYKSADDTRASTDGWSFHEMLRPDLPKENIDGEAIEWAVSRLRAHSSRTKILLVISDGTPADDSTLTENDPEYLHRHLQSVLRDILAQNDIRVCALGLDHSVDQYYPISSRIEVMDDLPDAIVGLCERILLQS